MSKIDKIIKKKRIEDLKKKSIMHIIGINEIYKERFIEKINSMFDKNNNLEIIDLEILSKEIYHDKNMEELIEEYNETNTERIKKNAEKKMEQYWIETMEDKIDILLNSEKLENKYILFLGENYYNKNNKKKINMFSRNKVIFDINKKQNCKDIIKYNLENFRNEIIQGDFPLEYLNHEYLLKKREELNNKYLKQNYIIRKPNEIINLLNINIDKMNQLNDINTVWIGDKKSHNGMIYFNKNTIGNILPWIACLNSIKEIDKIIKIRNPSKGSNKVKVEELEEKGFDKLNTNCYLYLVDSEYFFYDKIDNKDKLITNIDVPIIEKIQINNILEKLDDFNIELIKYNEKNLYK